MIVAFSGHSQYIRNPLDEKRVLEILEQRVGNMPCDFFLGEYGKFDGFEEGSEAGYADGEYDICQYFFEEYGLEYPYK